MDATCTHGRHHFVKPCSPSRSCKTWSNSVSLQGKGIPARVYIKPTFNPYLPPASRPSSRRSPSFVITLRFDSSAVKVVPLLVIVLSRAKRPHHHYNLAYYRHIHLSTMLFYTTLADVIAKTATFLSAAHLLDKVLTRLCECVWTRMNELSLICAINSGDAAVRCRHSIARTNLWPRCGRYTRYSTSKSQGDMARMYETGRSTMFDLLEGNCISISRLMVYFVQYAPKLVIC